MLRLLERQEGNYFICCATPFYGTRCPDCKTEYDNPYAFLSDNCTAEVTAPAAETTVVPVVTVVSEEVTADPDDPDGEIVTDTESDATVVVTRRKKKVVADA